MTGSFVYVLKGEHNMTKIGVSTNPTARIASLKTASAFPIDFAYVGVTPGNGFDIERRAHELLAKHRCNGEWFDVPPEMAVAAVAGAAHSLKQPVQEIRPDQINDIFRIGMMQGAGASSGVRAMQTSLYVILGVAIAAAIALTVAAPAFGAGAWIAVLIFWLMLRWART